MQGKTHMMVGMVAGLMLCQPLTAPAGIILGGIGGLLPDIDHPNSSISYRLPLLRLLTFWIPHRTGTHSLWAAGLMLLPGALIHPLLFCFAAGYALHIAADMMTRKGVPVLYPITKNPLYLLPRGFRLVTGGFVEWMFRAAVILLFAVLLLQILPFWLAVLHDPRLLDFALQLPAF